MYSDSLRITVSRATAPGQSHFNRAQLQYRPQCRISGPRQLRILLGVTFEGCAQQLKCDCPGYCPNHVSELGHMCYHEVLKTDLAAGVVNNGQRY